MNEIKFPNQTTYFICYENNKVFSVGTVLPTQEMTSGLPNLYKTTIKEDWLTELIKYDTYLGYRFVMEDDALDAQDDVNTYYGPDTCVYKYTINNDPNFWYIIGDYSPILGEPMMFEI